MASEITLFRRIKVFPAMKRLVVLRNDKHSIFLKKPKLCTFS